MAAAELKTLGRYNLERVLGKGAMGVVYEGVDPRLNRRVAIKTILKSNLDDDTAKDFAMRFVREAQAVARLNHPNIVQVYDFGEEGEVAYLVMEFIRGKELKTFFDANERFDLKEAVRIMAELCEALDFAHTAGIVHRDIKPANVMIDSQARTKLTDFGVARVQDTDKTSVERTQAGTMVGTPAYMSPEQITGGTVDKRSDVFSAGIILYQFLTGEKPFTGGGAWTIAKKIIQEDPPLASSINNAVTPLFDAVVNKALAKNPDERYQSARDLAVALRRALEGKPAEDDSDITVVGGAVPDIAPKAVPRPSAAVGTAESTKGTSTTQSGNQEVELEFWRAIKDGNDPDDFDLYVQQFPTGIYAALAKRKIAKLKGVTPEESGTKAKEQEKKEAEEAQRLEAVARQKLADEKAKLEAELARKEEEYKKREADAEAKRLAADQARADADAKREAEAKTRAETDAKARAEAIEKAKQEAAAERERAKQEAAAEIAKREAEYKKREAEGEAKRQAEAEAKAKKDAELRAKQETEAKAKREADEKVRREAEEKARKEAEAKAKKDAEDRAKRETEFKKREAELKAREADATLLASGKKKSSPVVPIIVGVVVLAIAGGGYFLFAPDDASQKAQLAAMQKQLEEAKQKAAEMEQAKQKEEQGRIALEKARAAEEAARKAGDVAKQRELAEQTKLREAEAKKQSEATRLAQADAKKSADAAKASQDKAAVEQRTAAEKGERAKQERVAAQEKAAAEAATRASSERVAAAEKAAQERIAAAEKAAADAAARAAAAEKAAQEKTKLASAAGAAPTSGDALFEQAAALEKDGKGNEAVRAYTRAARSGSGKAAKRLGEIYDKGLVGVSRDYAESLKWYNAARVLGEDVPMAKSR